MPFHNRLELKGTSLLYFQVVDENYLDISQSLNDGIRSHQLRDKETNNLS